jgi:membrane-associated phospholipid phosphatase
VTTGRRRVRPAGWWFDGLLVAGFVAITLALADGALLGLDLSVRDWCDRHQPAPLHSLASVGNRLGQGTPLTALCLLLALFLVWRRHSVRPVFPPVLAFILTFGTLTPLKDITDRAAPHAWSLAHPERFGSGGAEYPSGHLTNAIVWYGVLALLLAQWVTGVWRRLLRIAPPVILCCTTIYLGYHWLTDTVAGVLLGLFLDRLMSRIRWDDLPLGRRLNSTGWTAPGLDQARDGGTEFG